MSSSSSSSPTDWQSALESAGWDLRQSGRWIDLAPPGGRHQYHVSIARQYVYDDVSGHGCDLAAWLRQHLGVDAPEIPVTRRRRSAADAEADARRRASNAQLWLDQPPLASETLAAAKRALDQYLRSRGFPGGQQILDQAGLRVVVHSRPPFDGQEPQEPEPIYYYAYPITPPERTACAAVFAVAPDGTKAHLAAWAGDSRRTYGPRPKGSHQMLLPLRADLLDLGDMPGQRIVVGEGLETTLAAMATVGGHGVLCVDAGHVTSLLRHRPSTEAIRRIGAHLVIATDREPSGAGLRAARDCARLAQQAGIPAVVLVPPERYGSKADWNDVLQREGVAGAEQVTREAAEAARQAAEAARAATEPPAPDPDDPLLHMPRLRRIEGYVPAALPQPVDLDAERARLQQCMTDHITGTGPSIALVEVPCGTGKSHAGAEAQRTAGPDAPSVYVPATRAQRDYVAALAGSVSVPARSADPNDRGYCARYHDVVEPLAERHRGIMPHACQTCPLGQATMAMIHDYRDADLPIRPRIPQGITGDGMCSFIWHLEASKVAPHIAATAAKLMGDDGVPYQRIGAYRREVRALVVDDVSDLTRVSVITMGDVGIWLRTAPRQAAADDAAARDPSLEPGDRKRRAKRAELLQQVLPPLHRLLAWLSEHAGLEGQVRLDPAEWADLGAIVGNAGIDWIDATGAEAILRADDGTTEIPLRALRDLCGAITAGTCWSRRGILIAHASTEPLRLAKAGMRVMWLDATPPPHLRRAVAALGGTMESRAAQPPNLHAVLYPVGSHGKIACLPSSPSYARESDHLLAAIRLHAGALQEGESLAVLTHMDFADAVQADLARQGLADPDDEGIAETGYVLPGLVPGRVVYLGWWGRHDRAHNAWEHCQVLILWGVPILSPDAAEREWVSAETAVAGAGGEADPTWDAARVERWHQVPGAGWEIGGDGYARDDIDAWARSWTTARVVQGAGRLRATARPHEALTVHLYSMYPLAGQYGMRVDEVDTTVPWRTADRYQRDRRSDSERRVQEAAEALQAAGQRVSFRALNTLLRERGEATISTATYRRLHGAV